MREEHQMCQHLLVSHSGDAASSSSPDTYRAEAALLDAALHDCDDPHQIHDDRIWYAIMEPLMARYFF